jgi:serine/threonine protein kinase/tetratricopeptide (TPR) repeat protein
MPLVAGTRLGVYEILGPLGAGGMGEVYRVRDPRLGRDVAIKVLPGHVAASPERLARFEREAKAVAAVNHPNIVTLHSIEQHGGVHFLTMELVEGATLASLIARGGLPLPRILEISIPLTEALVAAHERGIVHRDLKPGNVMVTRDGRVKVLDFGLAKIAAGGAATGADAHAATTETMLTVEGAVHGTAPYMAPEQVRGLALDARSDLFSLGIILYELATGRRPFTGGTLADLGSSILRDTPRAIALARHDLPADLERIVMRCLEKEPRERFQTALDVRNELRFLLRAHEGGARATPAAPSRTATAEPQRAATTEPPGVASIAVLPFANRSADREDEYFSDGLADELLNLLAKIRGLRVAARTSAFLFRESAEDVGSIGRRLNVAALLEGSVRRSGNRVRISVQLVKVSDGYHLWSETYDRTLDDIFAVQDDIAQRVVRELRSTLLGVGHAAAAEGVEAEVARAAKGRGTSGEAHRLHLQARHLYLRFTRDSVAAAIAHFKEALALDPAFALAWAGLGFAYITEADVSWTPLEEGYGRARQAFEHALSLEPDLAEAHAGTGWIRMNHDWDWQGAEESYRRALELAPGNASALTRAALLAANRGRIDEAIGTFLRVLEQDPLNAAAYHNLGSALRAADRLPEAERAYRTALELIPQRNVTRASLSLTLLAQERSEEALAMAAEEPHAGFRAWALSIVQHALGHGAEADEALRGLREEQGEDYAFQIAQVHAMRGEPDAAFEWLERAHARRDTGLADLKLSASLRPLHGDPRWSPLLAKMRLEG